MLQQLCYNYIATYKVSSHNSFFAAGLEPSWFEESLYVAKYITMLVLYSQPSGVCTTLVPHHCLKMKQFILLLMNWPLLVMENKWLIALPCLLIDRPYTYSYEKWKL